MAIKTNKPLVSFQDFDLFFANLGIKGYPFYYLNKHVEYVSGVGIKFWYHFPGLGEHHEYYPISLEILLYIKSGQLGSASISQHSHAITKILKKIKEQIDTQNLVAGLYGDDGKPDGLDVKVTYTKTVADNMEHKPITFPTPYPESSLPDNQLVEDATHVLAKRHSIMMQAGLHYKPLLNQTHSELVYYKYVNQMLQIVLDVHNGLRATLCSDLGFTWDHTAPMPSIMRMSLKCPTIHQAHDAVEYVINNLSTTEELV